LQACQCQDEAERLVSAASRIAAASDCSELCDSAGTPSRRDLERCIEHSSERVREARTGVANTHAKSMSALDRATTEDTERPPDPSAFGVYYARLQHQQNMLQDVVRTDTYRRAIVGNADDFRGKVVLDVGAGTGILSFFAAQAGAGRVYAVEASAMAERAAALAASQGNARLARYAPDESRAQKGALSTSKLSADAAWDALDPTARIHVVRGKVEDVTIPEHVDVIISEPLGFLLVHERMLEAFINARDRFLKEGGLVMPSRGDIYAQPITDGQLWQEQEAKASFWRSQDFHGVDLSALHDAALDEYFGQAVVGYYPPEAAVSDDVATYKFDFGTCSVQDLRKFEIPFSFRITRTAILHGFGCWFDARFDGSTERVVLSTSPKAPGTHWYQSRLLLRRPVAVNPGQTVSGTLKFAVNDRLSYDVDVDVVLDGTSVSSHQRVRLDDQMYHYLTPGQPQVPHA